MPHTDSDHGLRVQLATALRERDAEKARADDEYERAEMFQRDARRSDAALVAEKARAEKAEADEAIAWSEVHDHEAVIRNFEASAAKLQAALAAAKARADAAEANALAVAQERLEERAQRERDWDALKAALAAARREIKDSRCVIWMLVTQAGGEVVIGGSVILRLDEVRARIETTRDPGGDLRIRAALAAPATGCPTCGCTAAKDPGVPCSDSWHDLRAEMGS